MNNQSTPQSQELDMSTLVWKVISRFLIMILIMMAILFLTAGRFDWWEAWAYVAMSLVVLAISRGYMLIKMPELAVERGEAMGREDVKSWDKVLMPLMAIIGPIVSWIVAGLDVRFGWSPDLPDGIQVIALLFVALGSLFGSWAMIANRFFSSQVRIQADRGQTVVSDGPYRLMRHPGYAGGLLSWVAAPFFFSSYWVAVPCVLVIVVTFIRATLEDRTLQEELPGYKEYAAQVRYRLIPGIW